MSRTSDSRPTIDRISDVALRILEEEGPAAVSMRRIARAVGITPMAIYHHFPDRDALLHSVTDREFEKLLGFMQARPLRGSAEDRLIAIMQGYVDYAFARPRIFDYVFSNQRPGARRYPKDFRARRSPTLNAVADLVSELMREDPIATDDVWEVAFTLWAHVHGFVMVYRAGRIDLSEKQFHALLRRSLRRLIHGFKA
jgi:AcrR family transcriptional regulator